MVKTGPSLPPEDGAMSTPPYLVSDAARKTHLLKALVESRSLLTIILPDFREPVSSAVLEVTAEHIILDELIPHSANLAFTPGMVFSVTTKLKGIPIKFHSRVDMPGQSSDGITYYACDIPEVVNYHQKRRDYRLPSRGATWPSILVSSINEAEDPSTDVVSLSGRVTDISMGGVSAEFDALPGWAGKDRTVSCSIELTDGPMLFSRALIRHIRTRVKGRKNRQVHSFGLEFISLNEMNRKQLQHWIFHSERKLLRS